MAIFTVYSWHPNTSEVHKINTFSLNSVLEKTFSFDPQECIFLQFQLKIVFAFLMKESCGWINGINIKPGSHMPPWSGFRWYLSFYIHEVPQQSQRSRFVSSSIRCNIAVSFVWNSRHLENTFSAVKTIMSNISRGRLPPRSPHGCRYSYGYCGQFSLSILFYRHFQN